MTFSESFLQYEQREQRLEAWERHADRLTQCLDDLPDDVPDTDRHALRVALANAQGRARVAQVELFEGEVA